MEAPQSHASFRFHPLPFLDQPLATNDNTLSLKGDYTDSTNLFTYLGYAKLQVWDPDLDLWTTVTTDNVDSLIESTYSSGYTDIQAIPEPGVVALVGLGMAALLLRFRRVAASAP